MYCLSRQCLSRISSDVLVPPTRSASTSQASTSYGAGQSSTASRRYFPPEKYVSVSQVLVYIGTVRVQNQDQRIPMIARVSISDYRGRTLLDTLVQPTHSIEDYRASETGYTANSFTQAPSFQDIQNRVSSIIRDKIVVGHRIWQFLSVLGISHPTLDTRDMALFLPLRAKLKQRSIVELSTLVRQFMARNVGLHHEDSLEKARACIDLFRACEDMFEGAVRSGEWPCELPPSKYAEYFS